MMAHRVRTALLVWLAWTLFALFAASQNYVSRAYYTPIPWGTAVRLALLDSYLWALLTPLAFTVAARVRPRRGNLRWPVPVLGAAGFALGALHVFLFMQAMPIIGFPIGQMALRAIPSTRLHSDVLTCWALFGIEVYVERERRARELSARLSAAQLEVLRMQLQPHFLFNTLHAISALMYRDVGAADRMMARLSDFLRLTLDSSAVQEVTVLREMECLDKYLEIEQVRFGERLEIRRAIAPATLDLMIPNLVLQPLVENAVRYAIAPRAEGGRIQITARVEDGALVVEVSDNGPGAAGEIREGVGISNTRARLDQLSGGAARLDLGNVPGGGFRARLSIPAHSEPVHASPDRR